MQLQTWIEYKSWFIWLVIFLFSYSKKKNLQTFQLIFLCPVVNISNTYMHFFLVSVSWFKAGFIFSQACPGYIHSICLAIWIDWSLLSLMLISALCCNHLTFYSFPLFNVLKKLHSFSTIRIINLLFDFHIPFCEK